jgi:geranylgeranyl pyrophosphate synthase
MAFGEKLMKKAIAILEKRGQKALELARQSIMQEEIEFEPLQKALRYFMDDWKDILHPALVLLACEAVGGNPDSTTEFGAALVLLAGGADIHDDIIDQSIIKGSNQTVFGKFGKDIAILAGDALLLKGIYSLHDACERLQKNKKNTIFETVKKAFFEISSAEAVEASFRGRLDIQKQEYLDIIKHKVAAAEAAMKIGAVLGNGTANETEALSHFGRTYGVMLTIRDEFIDTYETDELSNRVKGECLPLPISLALHDNSKRTPILDLLKGRITEKKVNKILDLSLESNENIDLVREMSQMAQEEIDKLSRIQYNLGTFKLLLKSTLEDL